MGHTASLAFLANLPQPADPKGLTIRSGAKQVSSMGEDLEEDTLMREPNNLLSYRLK